MSYAIQVEASVPHTAFQPSAGEGALCIHPLTGESEREALAFLAPRSIPTVFMTGLIYDNGLESPLNRGAFYACRQRGGDLEGIALVGHAMLVETRSGIALEAFAQVAQGYRSAHMIFGEQETVDQFWRLYSANGQAPRLICRELWFEQRLPVKTSAVAPGLRLARLDDLALVVPVQADMADAESGVNPLEVDPVGFRSRCARRIEQGRVWVWVEGGRLIFKADVMADTPEVSYLEGVWVAPEERGQGYGLRCLSQLGQNLLESKRSICLLVNEQDRRAQAFFRRAGYQLRGCYDTIYLQALGAPASLPAGLAEEMF